MKNKLNFVLILIIMLVIGIILGNKLHSAPSDEESTSSFLTAKSFDESLLKNRAVLFVKEGETLPHAEKILSDLARKHAINVTKVEYDEKFERFVENQEKIVTENYPEIQAFNDKLTKSSADKSEDQILKEDDLFSQALISLEAGKDIDTDIDKLSTETGLSKEEIEDYLEARSEMSKMKLLKPLSEEDGPVLVLFGSEKEYDRISALEQDDNSLIWLLTTKGFLNLSKKESLRELYDLSDKEETLVVTFGTSTCVYCGNTAPLVEKVAKELEVPYRYIDINTEVNKEDFTRFYDEDILMEVVENTPTVVVLKDGKEVDRFVGEYPYSEIEKFIQKHLEEPDTKK